MKKMGLFLWINVLITCSINIIEVLVLTNFKVWSSVVFSNIMYLGNILAITYSLWYIIDYIVEGVKSNGKE